MINVHASLLPRWRGAAPIIYSLANGDSLTGVTIMQIKPSKFDVGNIISQKPFQIPENMFMPELYTELGSLGANELIECLKDLPEKLKNAQPQAEHGISYGEFDNSIIVKPYSYLGILYYCQRKKLLIKILTSYFIAPKVTTSFTKINWKNMSSIQIFNLERALKGFLPLTSIWNGEIIKFYNVRKCDDPCHSEAKPGFISYDEKLQVLKAVCKDKNSVTIEKVQMFQKKIMSAKDFNNGYLMKTTLEQRYFL